MSEERIEYYVVESDTLEDFVVTVNDYLERGWQLLGGVACALSESDEYRYTSFCQAVIRKVEVKNQSHPQPES